MITTAAAPGPAVSRIARSALVVLALGGTGLALALGDLAVVSGRTFPEVADLVVPSMIALGIELLSALLCLVGLWRLLDLARDRSLQGPAAVRWLGVLQAASAGAALLPAAVCAELLFDKGLGGPLVALGLPLCIAGGAVAVGAATLARRAVKRSARAR